MEKVFITGMTGFIGTHLARLCHARGFEVHGTTFSEEESAIAKELGKISKVYYCDVCDRKSVEALIEKVLPQRIFHLAAQSFPTISWDQPAETMETNAIGTINVFESVKKFKLNPVVVVACSSAEYGQVFFDPKNCPVSESSPLLPLHPYGVSKVAQDLLAYQYFKNFGIRSVRCRIFNTTGPGKTKDAAADWALQIAKIEAGLQKPEILVGNLETFRDITDGRDMAAALLAASEKCEHGEVYNLSSSKTYKMRDVLEKLVSLSTEKISIAVDEKRLRPNDEPIISADTGKFVSATGWHAEIPIEKTLKDMIDFFRENLKR